MDLSSEFRDEGEPDESTIGGLLQLVESQRNLLVAAATGGPAIKTVEHQYQDRDVLDLSQCVKGVPIREGVRRVGGRAGVILND